MIKYIVIWILCTLVGMSIGIIIRKKFCVSKKVHDNIVLMFFLAPLVVGIVLVNLANISIYNQRVYIPSICYGLGMGWVLSSSLVKKQNEKKEQ